MRHGEAVMCFVLSVFIAVACMSVLKLTRDLDDLRGRVAKLETCE